MKVFISWSGERSRRIAELFRDWLPRVNQAVEPFFSPRDIDKGTPWAKRLADELQATSLGLFVLTPESLTAPWLLFEAGAIAKLGDESRVFTLCCGLNPNDVAGPLSVFQATRFNKVEVQELIHTLNELRSPALDSAAQDDVFESFWPKIDTPVSEIMATSPDGASAPPSRSEHEVLGEILSILRARERERVARPSEGVQLQSPTEDRIHIDAHPLHERVAVGEKNEIIVAVAAGSRLRKGVDLVAALSRNLKYAHAPPVYRTRTWADGRKAIDLPRIGPIPAGTYRTGSFTVEAIAPGEAQVLIRGSVPGQSFTTEFEFTVVDVDDESSG